MTEQNLNLNFKIFTKNIEPSKYRTSVESDKQQICCYNQNKKDKLFNKFSPVRKQSAGDSIIFEIENIFEETIHSDINYCKVTNELNKFNRNDGQATKTTVQQLSSTYITRQRRISIKARFLVK